MFGCQKARQIINGFSSSSFSLPLLSVPFFLILCASYFFSFLSFFLFLSFFEFERANECVRVCMWEYMRMRECVLPKKIQSCLNGVFVGLEVELGQVCVLSYFGTWIWDICNANWFKCAWIDSWQSVLGESIGDGWIDSIMSAGFELIMEWWINSKMKRLKCGWIDSYLFFSKGYEIEWGSTLRQYTRYNHTKCLIWV